MLKGQRSGNTSNFDKKKVMYVQVIRVEVEESRVKNSQSQSAYDLE